METLDREDDEVVEWGDEHDDIAEDSLNGEAWECSPHTTVVLLAQTSQESIVHGGEVTG